MYNFTEFRENVIVLTNSGVPWQESSWLGDKLWRDRKEYNRWEQLFS